MYGKNPYANKSQEELDEIFRKRSETNKNKSKDILKQEKINRSNASKKCWQNETFRRNVINGLQKSMNLDRINTLSELMSGKNNPMYGKNIKDYMSKEDYEIWLNKVRNNKQGEKNPVYDKKWMYNSNTNERIYVK